MDPDVYLTVGVICLVFSIPAVISAITDSRAPRAAAIVLLIGGGLIVLAVSQNPNGYALSDIPAAFSRVFGRLLG